MIIETDTNFLNYPFETLKTIQLMKQLKHGTQISYPVLRLSNPQVRNASDLKTPSWDPRIPCKLSTLKETSPSPLLGQHLLLFLINKEQVAQTLSFSSWESGSQEFPVRHVQPLSQAGVCLLLIGMCLC